MNIAIAPRWVLLSGGAHPTEDIYFLQSAASGMQARGVDVRRVDTRRWRSPRLCWPWLRRRVRGAHVLLCRSLAAPWLDWLECHRRDVANLHYLIDDDILAAAKDERLQGSYRKRMRDIAEHQQPRLLALADEVVTCSGLLAERFHARHGTVSVHTPPLISPLPDLVHFATRPEETARKR